jgi:hypothetical protein
MLTHVKDFTHGTFPPWNPASLRFLSHDNWGSPEGVPCGTRMVTGGGCARVVGQWTSGVRIPPLGLKPGVFLRRSR